MIAADITLKVVSQSCDEARCGAIWCGLLSFRNKTNNLQPICICILVTYWIIDLYWVPIGYLLITYWLPIGYLLVTYVDLSVI